MRAFLTIVILILAIHLSPAPTYPNYFTTNQTPAIKFGTNVAFVLDWANPSTARTNDMNRPFARLSDIPEDAGAATVIALPGRVIDTEIALLKNQTLSGLGAGASRFTFVPSGQIAFYFSGSNYIQNMTIDLSTNGGPDTVWFAGDADSFAGFKNCTINATFDLLHPPSPEGHQYLFDGCTINSMYDRFLAVANDTNSALSIINTTVNYDPAGRTYSPDSGNQPDQCYQFTRIENSSFYFSGSVTGLGGGGPATYGFYHQQTNGSVLMRNNYFDFMRVTNTQATFIAPPILCDMAKTNGATVVMDNVSWRDTNGTVRTFSTVSQDASYLASDKTSASTSLVTTGLTNYLVGGLRYGFKCVLFLSDSTSADGAKIDFAGGNVTETNFRAQCLGWFNNSLALSSHLDDITDVASASILNGDSMFEITGSFEPALSGNFVPRFAQASHSTGTLTLYRGSWMKFWVLP